MGVLWSINKGSFVAKATCGSGYLLVGTATVGLSWAPSHFVCSWSDGGITYLLSLVHYNLLMGLIVWPKEDLGIGTVPRFNYPKVGAN